MARSSSGKILSNSFWYGLETLLETVVFLGTSILVANYLGPEKLGYFSYLNFFIAFFSKTGGNSLASTTRKYMSEFLALDQPGIARAVYHFAYKYQLLGSITISALGVAGIALFGDPHYRTMAYILMLSIVPGVMSSVPAQANLAFEDLSKNTFSAFGYIISYSVVIGLTLHFHWDLVGVASASLIGRSVEVVLRTVWIRRTLRTLPEEPLPEELAVRIRRFCVEAIGIQVLMSVVWDRSEMVFLRAFSSLEQIGFYSVSFGLANNLLLVPRTFGGAVGVTLMVESTRDAARVGSIVRNASRYLLLVVLPVHLGAAAITAQAIRFVYQPRYLGAVPVLVVASLLSIPRAFQEIPEVLLRAADRQKKLFLWLGVTGVVNVALDWLLIPKFGAVGAAWANGLSQSFGVIATWQQARQFFRFGFPVGAAVRLGLAAGLMGGFAFEMTRLVPTRLGLGLAVATAVPVYVLLVKLFGGLEHADRDRLEMIGARLGGPAQRMYLAMVGFVIPRPLEM